MLKTKIDPNKLLKTKNRKSYPNDFMKINDLSRINDFSSALIAGEACPEFTKSFLVARAGRHLSQPRNLPCRDVPISAEAEVDSDKMSLSCFAPTKLNRPLAMNLAAL